MKKSEIKDLYNNSETALMAIKAVCLLLPYDKDVDELALKAAAQVSTLYPVVKQMCDYMIDDGGYNMSERLQEIDRELRQIESDVAKMGYSKERYILCRNCRAIINTIKDVDIWGNEPQQKPNKSAGGELAGCEPKTPPEPTGKPIVKESLPTIYDDEEMKNLEQHVFYNAITSKNKWMTLNADGKGYKWNKKKNLLAYLCGRLYWGDKVCLDKVAMKQSGDGYDIYKLDKSDDTLPEPGRLRSLFGVDVSNNRSQLKEPPQRWQEIDKLFE